MRRAFSVGAALLVMSAIGAPAPACSSFSEEDAPPPQVEAGAEAGCSADLASDHDNCGACGTRCGDTEYCAASKCEPGCPEPILYVSPTGLETNDGCTPKRSKATIGGAIARVATLKLRKHAVHVCRGVYPEALTLSYPVSLRGGYECSSFKRTDKFGFGKIEGVAATGFDRVNESKIEAPPSAAAGLVVTGAAVDRSVTIEGFTITGRAASTTGAALSIEGGASPTVQQNEIVGGDAGAAAATMLGTYGVTVRGGSAPLLTKNRIKGGAGKGAFVGSMGVLLAADAGAAAVVTNEIQSGAGMSAGIGGIGVAAQTQSKLIGESAIRGNAISSDGATGTIPAIDVSLNGGEVDLSDNVISVGSVVCAAAVCSSTAVRVDTVSTVRITGNRVHAGFPKGGGSIEVFGISLQRTKDAAVVNNMVHPGTTTLPHNSYAMHARGRTKGTADPVAVNPRFAHNTVLLGATTFATAFAFDEYDLMGIRVVSNLVLATPQRLAASAAIRTAKCTNMDVLAMAGNAFIGTGIIGRHDSACDGGAPMMVTTPDDLEALYKSEFSTPQGIMGNVAIQGTCAGARCTADPGCELGSGCLDSLLAGWSAPSEGALDLFAGGWQLASKTPCTITRGGFDLSSMGVAADSYATPRTNPVSPGAHEYDGMCAPP